MKKLILIVSMLASSLNLLSQEYSEEYTKACSCIGEISLGLDRKDQFTEVESCIESAISVNQMMTKLKAVLEQSKKDSIPAIGKKEEKREYNVVINDREGYDDLEEQLLRTCATMKRIMTTSNEVSEVSISDKKSAKKAYDAGMEVYRNKNMPAAIKQFKKAVRKDPSFAWAWDMLGISYRQNGQYDLAIKAYDKSVALDPKGRMPLMNLPIAYSLKGDIDKAIEGYIKFNQVFPDDPEGQYGIGRMYHAKGDYEAALESMAQALLGYKNINSPYAQDAEDNLGLYYAELKEKDQLEIWNVFAKKYNIKLSN